MKTALAAALLALSGSSAFAQTYGGGPSCGYGHGYDLTTQSCVSLSRQGGYYPGHMSGFDRQYPRQNDVVE
jgi:hypothetical protein